MSKDCCDSSDVFDCIQEAADCIRKCVSEGYNRYKLKRIIVTWSGVMVGNGIVSLTEELDITPSPTLSSDAFDGMSLSVVEGGRNYSGFVEMTLSNSISESMLTPTLRQNQEFFFELIDKKDKNAERLRLFPVRGVKIPSGASTSRIVAMEIMEDARTKDGILPEKIKTFVPRV